MQAISFALYGKSLGNLINKPDLVNNLNKKDMLVELTFTKGKDRYFIKRGIEPQIFEIYKNDVLMPREGSAIQTQNVFEERVLRMDFRTFSQIIALNSRNYVPFLKLLPQQRRDFIADLYELDTCDTMAELNDKDIEKLQTEIGAIVKNIDKLELLKTSTKSKRQFLIDRRKEAIKNQKDNLDQLKISRDETDADIKKIDKKISMKEVEYRKLAKSSLAKDGALSDMKTLLSTVRSDIKRLTDEVEYFRNHDTCITCHQLIEQKFSNKRIKELNDYVQSDSKTLNEIETVINSIQVHSNKMNNISSEISDLEYERSSLQSEFNKYTIKIDELEKYNSELISGTNEEVEEYDNNIEQYDKEIKSETTILNNLKDKLQDLTVVKQMLKETGVKSLFIRKNINEINRIINKHLNELGAHIYFEFDEHFDATIKRRYIDDLSYENFSEGQKARINLAIMFCWREIVMRRKNASMNILFLDEVFEGSTDADGVHSMTQILNQFEHDTNIFVISHQDKLTEWFDTKLEFELENEFTKLKEDA